MSEWRLRLFGGLSLESGDEYVNSFGTARAAKLLAMLAVFPGGKMNRERLADQLWPDDFFDATRLRLRQEIHRLRRSMGSAGSLLGSSVDEVWLLREEFTTDLDLLHAAETGSGPFPAETLQREFLPSWDDLWVLAERAAAERLRDRTGTASAKRLLESGNAQEALDLAHQLIELNPLDEDLRMVAVNAHAKLGSMAAAMAEYQDLRRQVKDRLGTEPSMSGEELVRELESFPAPTPTRGHGWEQTIPQPVGELVGRETLLDQVLGEVRRSRLVSLIGPGGIGKTRLAVEAAKRLNQEKVYAVAFASLAEVADPASWARSVLTQLGSDAPVDTDPNHYLGALLSQFPTLLILDNLETILPAASESVQSLVASAPDLRVLTTSIIPTKFLGERAIAIGPLDSESSGVEMLKQSLSESRAALLGSQDSDLAAIANRLDGYPLALRLVGARLRLLSPRELLGQLDGATSNPGATDLPERHRSLRAALTGTLASISPCTLDALHRTWAYPGGMGMGLAATEFDEGYLEVIESLLDSALVVLDDHRALARVRLLAPVRQFIEESLEADRRESLQAKASVKVLRYLVDTGIAPWEPVSTHTLDKLVAEVDNLHAAWNWAKRERASLVIEAAPAMARFENLRGNPHKLLEDLQQLADVAQQEQPRGEAAFQLAIAHAAFGANREEETVFPLARVGVLLNDLSAPKLQSWHAACLAAYALRKDFAAAEGLTKSALQMAEEFGHAYASAWACKRLANIYNFKRQNEQVLPYIQRADNLFRQCEADTEWCANAIYFGAHLWFSGDHVRSSELLLQAKEQLARHPAGSDEAYLWEIEGRLAHEQGRFDVAEAAFLESLRLWRAMGSAFQEADQLHSLAKVHVAQERWSDARRVVLQAAAKWIEDGNGGGLCCSLFILGRLLLQDQRPEDAARVLGFADAFSESSAFALVQTETDFRDQLERLIGHVTPYSGEISMEAAARQFDLIR